MAALCRVTDSQTMQEETLREKQAVQQRLQSAVDMQTALEKAFQAKVGSLHGSMKIESLA